MKRIISSLFMIAVLTISLFSLPSNSNALSCVQPPEPLEAFGEADTVLIGTVKKVEEGAIGFKDRHKEITLEVKDVFKGDFTSELVIREDLTWGESTVDNTYLYYLKKEGNNLINPLCSATTTNLEEANAFVGLVPQLDVKPAVPVEVENDKVVTTVNPDSAVVDTTGVEESNLNETSGYIWGFIIGFIVTLGTIILVVRSVRQIRGNKK